MYIAAGGQVIPDILPLPFPLLCYTISYKKQALLHMHSWAGFSSGTQLGVCWVIQQVNVRTSVSEHIPDSASSDQGTSIPSSAIDFLCDLDTLPHSKLIILTLQPVEREDCGVTAVENNTQPFGRIRTNHF